MKRYFIYTHSLSPKPKLISLHLVVHHMQVLRLFQVNKINGRVLHTLSDTDLKDLGVEAMGDRRYLLQLFKKRSDVVHIADDTPQVSIKRYIHYHLQ